MQQAPFNKMCVAVTCQLFGGWGGTLGVQSDFRRVQCYPSPPLALPLATDLISDEPAPVTAAAVGGLV